MAYSSYASQIESAITEINTSKDKVKDIDFTSTWTGDASTSLNGKITTLLSMIATEMSNAQKIANACNQIDIYDEQKAVEDRANISYNNLDRNSPGYTYASSALLNQISSAQEKQRNAKNNANTNLNGVSSSYNTQYKELTFSDIKSTKETFENVLNNNDSIKNGLDLSKIPGVADAGNNSNPTETRSDDLGSFEGVQLQYSAAYDTGDHKILTKSGGVCDIYGHHETYYDEKVLPGGGLNIPGRHVAEDGTIRDENGYICVACDPSFLPKGSTLMTSLGPAKVYDCGCAYGTVDIYVNW